MKCPSTLTLLASLASFATLALAEDTAPSKPKILLSLAVMPGLTAKSGDHTATYGEGTMVLNLPAVKAGQSVDVDVTFGSDPWKCTFSSVSEQDETAIFVLMEPMSTGDKLLVREESVGVKGKCTKGAGGGGGGGGGNNA